MKKIDEKTLSGDALSSLTLAACTLMADNPDLSPQDAVGDVMQVYGLLEENFSGEKKPSRSSKKRKEDPDDQA